MWNNKKIKVLDNYSITNTRKGDIITVDGNYEDNHGKILTVNDKPYVSSYNDWCFPANDGKFWEIIEEITPTPVGWPDLIVGKWYKQSVPICSHIQAIKFKAWDTKYKGCPLHSGVITNGIYHLDHNGGGIFNSDFGKALIKCTIQEIQQYLPEGHPDKKQTEYLPKTGDYAVTSYTDQGDYIFKASSSYNNNPAFINTKSHVFYVNAGDFRPSNGFKNYRRATPEERQWLDACIAKNAFVTKEEALKPPTTMYKFEIGQEVNPTKNGYFYCSPEEFYKQPVSDQNEFKTSRCSATKGRIKDRKTVSNTNWYLLEDYGNWLSEEALEAIPAIPKYLECISPRYSYLFIGRIYKLNRVNASDISVVCNLNCNDYPAGSVLYTQMEAFKPSTKEAYEAQKAKKAGIAKAPESLVGRYVKVLKPKCSWFINIKNPKEGDVYKICSENSSCVYVEEDKNNSMSKGRFNEAPFDFELMPEGWKPSPPTSISITKSTTMKYPHPIGTKVLYQEKEHVIEAYYAASPTNNPNALISGPKGSHDGGGNLLEDEFGNTIYSDGKNNKYFVQVKELSLVKETLLSYKFKVGDRVIGNSGAVQYTYTTTDVTGVVTNLFETRFEMKIDAGFSNSGATYKVDYDSFDLYQPAKYPTIPKESFPVSLNLKNTKIWIGDNPSLCQKVFDALKKLGADPKNTWDNKVKQHEGYPASFYIDSYLGLSYSSGDIEKKQTFTCNPSYRVITPEDLGIYSSPFDTKAIHSRLSEIKQEEGDVSIGKVKRMLIPVKTI